MSDTPRDLAPIDQTIPEVPDVESLLPYPSVQELTAVQTQRLQQFQTALIVIGQAAGGVLVCPGNQVGVPDVDRCAYAAKCELLRAQKAPQNELCPIERELAIARFNGWAMTIGANTKALREDERAVIAELTWIDIQEQRCSNILSRGEASRLTQINIKDVSQEGVTLSWERVIHSNAELLESLHTRKRMIMKEWMLTPEQKFKVAKAMGKLGADNDMSKKLSARADRIKNLDAKIIDAEYVDSPK